MDLSVVIPVKNEAENVRPLITEIRTVLEGRWVYEVIYVDDGSDDATLRELQTLMVEVPQLRTLRHARNCGQSTGLRTGVRAARADWVVTLDGDGQNDPADIPALVDRLEDPSIPRNLQLIIGHRAERHDRWLRRFSSRVANRVRATLLKDATPDSGCGLKIFSRQAFLDLPYFDHMHRFLPALFQRNGGQVISVPVNHRPRTRGLSKYGLHNRLWVGITDLFGVMWLLRRAKLPEVSEVSSDPGTEG
jgi:dolichol-phosphate mannosyltransferase